jgi:hypothetical protein
MLRDSTPFTFSDVEMGEVMTGTRESASVLDAYYFRLALAVADADSRVDVTLAIAVQGVSSSIMLRS